MCCSNACCDRHFLPGSPQPLPLRCNTIQPLLPMAVDSLDAAPSPRSAERQLLNVTSRCSHRPSQLMAAALCSACYSMLRLNCTAHISTECSQICSVLLSACLSSVLRARHQPLELSNCCRAVARRGCISTRSARHLTHGTTTPPHCSVGACNCFFCCCWWRWRQLLLMMMMTMDVSFIAHPCYATGSIS